MAIARFEQIIFIDPVSNKYTHICEAKHERLVVGTAVGMMDSNKVDASLIRFVTSHDYRSIGIAHTMLDHIVQWGRKKQAIILHGYVASQIDLLDDSQEHVVRYLANYGFTIDGIFFSMKL